MTIQSHSDLGAKCIDVPYAQFFRGMRFQMWACNNVLVWGQPNTEVTLGVARKTGRSEIRVRIGETPTQGLLLPQKSHPQNAPATCRASVSRCR